MKKRTRTTAERPTAEIASLAAAPLGGWAEMRRCPEREFLEFFSEIWARSSSDWGSEAWSRFRETFVSRIVGPPGTAEGNVPPERSIAVMREERLRDEPL